MPGANLHIHTTYSDGDSSVAEILDAVRAEELEYYSITDHDSIRSVKDVLMSPSAPDGFIPGSELSVSVEGTIYHVLMYFKPESMADVSTFLERIEQKRMEELLLIHRKARSIGIDLPLHSIRSLYGHINIKSLTRYLSEKKLLGTYEDVFRRFFYPGGTLYTKKFDFGVEDLLFLHKTSGCLLSYAHPQRYQTFPKYFELFPKGLVCGIEVYQVGLDEQNLKTLCDIAEAKGLIITGGSDFHEKCIDEGRPSLGKFPGPLDSHYAQNILEYLESM